MRFLKNVLASTFTRVSSDLETRDQNKTNSDAIPLREAHKTLNLYNTPATTDDDVISASKTLQCNVSDSDVVVYKARMGGKSVMSELEFMDAP